MKNLSVAFLYNVRHKYPNPNDATSQLEADFDDPETIKLMIKHLENCGFDVIPIEANEEAYMKLYKNKKKIDIAFNYSEGIYGNDREAQIPAMLEMLQIPYTGSTPLTQTLSLNKVKTKEILSFYDIPVSQHQIFKTNKEELEMKFPVIVKPIAQGSSMGITNSSVVFNEEQLRKQIDFVLKLFKQPVMVEKYLSGREFSVAMLGNPPEILPIIEPNHSLLPKELIPIDSLEVKWVFEEQFNDYLMCPAKIDKKLEDKIKHICLKVWEALNIRDLCRIDIRCDENNNPYFLEVNSPPGLIPPEVSMTSYFPLAARAAGIDYESLLKKIITSAAERYGLEIKD